MCFYHIPSNYFPHVIFPAVVAAAFLLLLQASQAPVHNPKHCGNGAPRLLLYVVAGAVAIVLLPTVSHDVRDTTCQTAAAHHGQHSPETGKKNGLSKM